MKKEEKKEFWIWLFFFVGLVFWIIIFYKSIESDKAIWATSKEVSVTVSDKIVGGRRQRNKIRAYHEHTLIYVDAGKRWFRQAKVGSTTLVRYSPKYNSYMDRYHKFNVDKFFLICLITLSTSILWRIIWLGLYIWYRK